MMKDNDFIETISKVSFLVKETFDLDNVLSPQEFFHLWDRNKINLPITDGIKNSDQGIMCFYNHYLVLNLLQRTANKKEHPFKQAANDAPFLRFVQ